MHDTADTTKTTQVKLQSNFELLQMSHTSPSWVNYGASPESLVEICYEECSKLRVDCNWDAGEEQDLCLASYLIQTKLTESQNQS